MIIDLTNRAHVSCPFRVGATCTGAACPLWRFMPGSAAQGYCGPGGMPAAPIAEKAPEPTPALDDPPVALTEKKTTDGARAPRARR